MSSRPRPCSSPAATMPAGLLAEALDAATVLVAHEVALGADDVGHDAPVEGVEVGGDGEPLLSPGLRSSRRHHRLGRVAERHLDARGDDGRRPARGCHRLGDQPAPLGCGRARPVDVEDSHRVAHRVHIGASGGPPQAGGEERDGAIEPARCSEVDRLAER